MSRYQHQIPIEKLPARVWADKPGLDLAEQLEASIEDSQRKCERKTMADKIVLRTNEWAELALKWPDGKNLEGQYGPSVMFTTTDDRVLFLPPYPAEKVRALKLNPGERFNIRKAEVNGANGSRPHIEWQVARIDPPAGAQQNGTLVIPKEKEAAVASPEVPAAASGMSSEFQSTPPVTEAHTASVNSKSLATGNHTASPFQHTGHAALLRDTTNMLVDVLATCKNYASRYNGVVSAEDIRSIVITAYIQTKGKQ